MDGGERERAKVEYYSNPTGEPVPPPGLFWQLKLGARGRYINRGDSVQTDRVHAHNILDSNAYKATGLFMLSEWSILDILHNMNVISNL